MSDSMLPFASATRLRAMLANGEIGSLELLDMFCARIERYNPDYNLVISFDLDRARKEAAEADRKRSAGEEAGPLAGLPMTIKECYESEGMVASCGFEFLRDHRPERDADAVAKLRQAGAIIFGKTNLPQGASDWQSFNPIYGLSRNPWDPTRSPGGSSGGSAGAIACGFSAVELGSDIGGSIRIPAHFCGVFGHKPSYGVVPMRGHIPPMPGSLYEVEMGVGGPLARSASDLALMLPILARDDKARLLKPPRHEQLRDFRAGVFMGEGSDYLLDGGYGAMLESYIADLEKAGAQITRVSLPVDPQESYEVYLHTLFSIVGASAPGESEIFASFADGDETGIAGKLSRYMASSLPEWFGLCEKRAAIMAAWARFFESFDVLLTPQVPILAFPHMADGKGVHSEQLERRIIVNGREEPYLDFTWQGLATVANLPATCMPTGRQVDGLPGGLQIIGPFMEDATAIRFAELAEREVGGYVPPPALLG
jgi:amidase